MQGNKLDHTLYTSFQLYLIHLKKKKYWVPIKRGIKLKTFGQSWKYPECRHICIMDCFHMMSFEILWPKSFNLSPLLETLYWSLMYYSSHRIINEKVKTAKFFCFLFNSLKVSSIHYNFIFCIDIMLLWL